MSSSPTDVFRQRLREERRRRGLSRDHVSAQLRKLGHPIDAQTVGRIESGRIKRVPLDDVFALSYVLDLSPLFLLLPSQQGDPPPKVAPLEGAPAVPHYALRAWLRGYDPLPGQDVEEFVLATPRDEQLQRLVEREESEKAQRKAEAAVDELTDDDVVREIAAERELAPSELPRDAASLQLYRAELVLRYRTSDLKRSATRRGVR